MVSRSPVAKQVVHAGVFISSPFLTHHGGEGMEVGEAGYQGSS